MCSSAFEGENTGNTDEELSLTESFVLCTLSLGYQVLTEGQLHSFPVEGALPLLSTACPYSEPCQVGIQPDVFSANGPFVDLVSFMTLISERPECIPPKHH